MTLSLDIRLSDLVTAVATDIKQQRTWITGSSSGNIAGLNTANKTSLVAAINEVLASAGGGDVTQADLDALKTEILGAGVPAALDTLAELADALADDANFAASVTAALDQRVRMDILMPGLTEEMQSNARINIQAVAVDDIGNFDADLVAQYTAAKA